MGWKISGANAGKIADVQNRQIDHESRSDQLTKRPAFAFKSGAERLVPDNNFVQRSLEDALIERAFPAERETHVKGWIAPEAQLIEQPKTSLRKGSGKNENTFAVRCRDLGLVIDFRCDWRKLRNGGLSISAQ